MIRHAFTLLCAVLLLSCSGPFDNAEVSSLCAPPLRGKLVPVNPPCAGVVIQVTGGQFQASQVQESFTDSNGNTYSNAFRLMGICEMPEADAAWLADPENIDELFPDARSHIALSDGKCNDTPE
jgi:hypothetical protein